MVMTGIGGHEQIFNLELLNRGGSFRENFSLGESVEMRCPLAGARLENVLGSRSMNECLRKIQSRHADRPPTPEQTAAQLQSSPDDLISSSNRSRPNEA